MYNSSSFQECVDDDPACPHPSAVCEPIHLASIPEPSFTHIQLLQDNSPHVSGFQRSTLQRILSAFEKGDNFLLGDATGVGKGRTIASLIHEWKLRHADRARCVWISASMRLKDDANNELSYFDLKLQNDAKRKKDSEDTEDHSDWLHFTSFSSLLHKKSIDALFKVIKAHENVETLIIIDECHMLRNKGHTTNSVLQFLTEIPEGHILYSSATAVSHPQHLHYLNKIGLFGEGDSAFPNHETMLKALSNHGPSMMELVAVHMRSRGTYVSRQLSFKDMKIRCVNVNLRTEEMRMYDECSQAFAEANLFGGSAHQMFFQRLITGFKTKGAIQETERCLSEGKSVVISVVGTGEALQKRLENGNSLTSFEDSFTHVSAATTAIDGLSTSLDIPKHPIDQLINHFGADNVAELTGRIRHQKGKSWNQERDAFQSGNKHIAIISRAGSTGISLHDMDDRPRVHIVLELPWSAEDFTQQLGRTHRSNSKTTPEFILLSSSIPSEQRFINAIVLKMRSMGALIKGDSRVTNMDTLQEAHWGIHTKRIVTIQMAYAYCAAKNVERREMSTFEAMLQLEQRPRRNVDSKVLLQPIITYFVKHIDIPEISQEQLAYAISSWLGIVNCLIPQIISPVSHKWSPRNHTLFPAHTRRRVFTTLLCWSSLECKTTLGCLPKELLFVILSSACNGEDLERTNVLHGLVTAHQVKLEKFPTSSSEFILNRMMGMPVHAQYSLYNMLDNAFEFEGTRALRPFEKKTCILQLAQERVMS